jgi:hypothetical protein
MSKGGLLKTAFVASKLDQLQPDWRDGSDVTQETKNKIQKHAHEKYKGLLDELLEEADESISMKSIDNAICKARKKMGIINPKGKRKNSPVRGSSKHQIVSDFATNPEAKDTGNKEVYPQIGEQSMLVSINLFDEIKRLVSQYSLEEVKKVISIIEGAIFQSPQMPCSEDRSECRIAETEEALKRQKYENAELQIPMEETEVQEFS